MITATLTSKGQLTIPKKVRDALHLAAGDSLVFDLREDGTVVVRKRKDIRDLFGILKTDKHLTIEEMNEVIRKGWAGQLPRD